MHHYIAFLRGINLGRRRIKMDHLRGLFEEMNFTEVATFIASGNVIFSSKNADVQKLSGRIQAHLHQSLGYPVDTFVRTRAEIAAVAAFRPFSKADFDHPDHNLHVGFLADPLDAEKARRFLACRTEVDEFCVRDREYYWLCRFKRSSDSTVWASPQMRALKLPTSSMRSLTTIRKLAAQYPAE